MAASVSFVVLYPNGRQQTIKTSKHSSIWQVLHDACVKQGLNPTEHQLYHHNKKLSPALLVSLANLPNNAQLELREGNGEGCRQPTTICLQTESGERLMDKFGPTTTLWEMLSHWESRGRLRRLPGEEAVCVYMHLEIVGKKNLQSTTLQSLGLIGGNAVIRLLFRPRQTTADAEEAARATDADAARWNGDSDKVGPSKGQEWVICEEDIKYIGERKGILFDLEHSLPLTFEEPGEDFFQLTLEDAKYLAADYRRQRLLLEERPLETERLRTVREQRTGRAYGSTLVRVYFPNRLVLQGTFLPHERVVDVMQFVRGFLQQPSQEFYLYTSPPRTLLEASSTLLHAKLVPAAVVHFGSEHPLPKEQLLRKEVLAMISTPSGASVAAHRLWSKRSVVEEEEEPVPQVAVQQPPSPGPVKVPPSSGKTPKWFTMSKGKK